MSNVRLANFADDWWLAAILSIELQPLSESKINSSCYFDNKINSSKLKILQIQKILYKLIEMHN